MDAVGRYYGIVQQRSRQLRRGRCRLNAKAALPCKPKERIMRRIAANDGQPIGRKAAQAGPFTFNAVDVPIDNLLQPINGQRDIIFFGRGIACRCCGLVMRA